MTTKIHTLTDALGRPLRFILTGGQAHDSTTAPSFSPVVTRPASSPTKPTTTTPCERLSARPGPAVIPSTARAKSVIPHDRVAYRLRNRIERFFNKLKHFRHIATRYDRRAIHFLAAIHLASAMIWMR